MATGKLDVARKASLRLRGFDYASAATYYVTLVTHGRQLFFEAPGRKQIVEDTWRWLAERYEHVQLDEFVVMPNHLHGLITISYEPTHVSGDTPQTPGHGKTLGRIVGAFKTVSSRALNQNLDGPGLPVWQRNFHDQIIRSDRNLKRARQYIVENPSRWHLDPENPLIAGTSVRA